MRMQGCDDVRCGRTRARGAIRVYSRRSDAPLAHGRGVGTLSAAFEKDERREIRFDLARNCSRRACGHKQI